MGLATGALLALAAALQVPQATVTGVVSDASTGRVLAGATIVVTDTGLGALSDDAGIYSLSGVPAGPQHLRISQLGYAARTVHALVPSTGSLELHVALRAQPIELRGIEVESRALRAIEPVSEPIGSGGRRLSSFDLRHHPLVAEPDALRALAGSGVVMDPEAPYGLHVRGGDAGHTGFMLDGIPVLDPVHVAGLFSAWNPAALDAMSLSPAAPSPSLPHALSGVVEGSVRAPGERTGAEASLSTTQAALTAHGPVRGAGYVLSLRSGFPGLVVPTSDPSYLGGESGDAILHIEGSWLGGEVEALYYSSDNEITLGRLVDPLSGAISGGGPAEWTSRSIGLTWRARRPGGAMQLKAWQAGSTAETTWIEAAGASQVASRRRDLGLRATLTAQGDGVRRELDVGVERIATRYAAAGPFQPDVAVPVLGVSGEQTSELGGGVRARMGGGLRLSQGRVYVPAQAALSWSPAGRLTLHVSAARTQQFTQSVANTESIARHTLPFELPVAAGVDGVPVPSSDQLVLGFEWQPLAGFHVTGEAYARRLRDLLLVAPVETAPFARFAPVVGSGSARGASLEVAGAGARLAWLARYDLQRVLRTAGDAFRPAHGATHLLSAGLTAHPGSTWSMRVGFDAALGRRATEVLGPFEWEACNLGDGGCEFAGAPSIRGPLGSVRLPAYLRADVGVRKHWHIAVNGRSAILSVFGSVTNVLGRHNVLTYVRDSTGGLSPARMLPVGPLVVGVDWRF